VQRFNKICLKFSYNQDEHLMAKTTRNSDVVDDEDDDYTAALLQALPLRTRRRKDDPYQEPGQVRPGPKKSHC
jgi:hypothetical protein